MWSKERFKKIVAQNIDRAGIDDIMSWLEETDFYTAPASTKWHGAYEGGLLEHTLQVYDNLRALVEFWQRKEEQFEPISPESIAIAALFHDVCKTEYYIDITCEGDAEKQYTTVKGADWKYHGEKSVHQIEFSLELTEAEKAAIRYHMGAFHDKDCGAVYEKYPLAWLLHVADEEAAYIQGR